MLKSPLTIVGGLVLVIAVAFITVVILGQGLSENARMIVIASIFTTLSTAIPALLALLKTESIQHDLRNGVVKDKVKDAVEEMAADPNSAANVLVIPAPPSEERKAEDG